MQPSTPPDPTRRTGRAFAWIAWLLALGLLYVFFDAQLAQQINPNQNLDSVQRAGKVEVVLEANRAGHYVASGTINRQPVVFLLDTGATQVAIPLAIAEQLNLQLQREVRVQTANGVARAYQTQLDSLTIGAIELRNVDATVVPGMGMSQILLGMSALKQVEFSQRNQTLTIRY